MIVRDPLRGRHGGEVSNVRREDNNFGLWPVAFEASKITMYRTLRGLMEFLILDFESHSNN